MTDLRIAGMQPVTLLDYPGKVAVTVFLQGCNMKCPFCHNAGIIRPDMPGQIPFEEIAGYLDKRKNLLDAVVISGGEPSLQDVMQLAGLSKALGYMVKIDTNGLKPDTIKNWVQSGFVDYIAMDVKSGIKAYGAASGIASVDTDKITESASFLINSGIDYEFRTTVTPSLQSPEDIGEIARYIITGAKRYWIQPYVPSPDVPCLMSLRNPSDKFLTDCLTAARMYIPSAAIRGRDLE